MSLNITTSPYTMPAALQEVENILGYCQWTPGGDSANCENQAKFLTMYQEVSSQSKRLTEIEKVGSWNREKIVEFLKQRNFSIDVQKLDKISVGLTAALELIIDIEGRMNRHITTPYHKVYPCMVLSVSSYQVRGHSHPVLAISTVQDTTSYITMLDIPPGDEQELIDTARHFESNLQTLNNFEAHIPLVEVASLQSIDWLLGLKICSLRNGDYSVAHASQIIKFGMRPKQIEEKAVFRGDPYIVNRPFMLWVSRRNLSWPFFVGYFPEEYWRSHEFDHLETQVNFFSAA